MSDAFRSPHPVLDRVVAYGKSNARALVVGLSLAFLLGLAGLPYLNALDNASGFLAGLAQWLIGMSLIIPPVVLVFVGVDAGRSFISSRYDRLLADAEDPHNVSARRTVRALKLLASGGRIAKESVEVTGGVAQVGLSITGYLVGVVLWLLLALFIVGGIIGLLMLGWRAL